MHADSPERVIVVSPHLDDAVLSLGSWMAAMSERAEVRVVTVMAGDPLGDQPASSWDRRCGFESQAEATEARRREDALACEIAGVEPVWLSFTNGVYGFPDDEMVWAAVRPHLDWADVVLIPGYPLRHPDHEWLATLLSHRMTQPRKLGLYLEQPYAARQKLNDFTVPVLGPRFGGTIAPSVAPYGRDLRAIKRRAARSYVSQLRPLSRRFPFVVTRLLRYESARGGETIAWLEPDSAAPNARVSNSLGFAPINRRPSREAR